jgi:hypothetical protein
MTDFGPTGRRFSNVWKSALVGTGLLALSACSQPMSQVSDIALGRPTAGPTPFIGYVPLTGQSLKQVVAYRYVISPKLGAVSRPVDVSYTTKALSGRGYYTDGTATSTLPVFGLYAGHINRVDVQVEFSDGSTQTFPVSVPTPAYVDPNGIFDRPNILKKRASSQAGDIDYFYLKTWTSGPIVIDTDAEIRWVPPAPINGNASTFFENRFIVGAQNSLTIDLLDLDGRRASTSLTPASYYSSFHHNLDLGKHGVLGEVDGLQNGVKILESTIVDFDSTGQVRKSWDFADIISRHMRANGDDPTLFVRPGIDWFHSNSAIYDRRDDSLIVSSRENFVIKVDYDTGAIKWILGDPTKYWSTFPSLRAKALTLDAGGLYPIGQHALSIAPDGRLLLFNNGGESYNQPVGAPVGEKRTYSAASAYDIDPVAMKAKEAWRFDYNQSIFSDICSSVYATSSGSLLLDYAAAEARSKARIVGLDPSRNVTFDFEYEVKSACQSSWNAEPIAFDEMTFN